MVMEMLNASIRLLNSALLYLHENAWHILLLLGAGWFVKTQFLDPALKSRSARRLSDNSSRGWVPLRGEAADRQRHEDMRRIREQQQEAANQRAKEAAAAASLARKKKQEEEEENKKDVGRTLNEENKKKKPKKKGITIDSNARSTLRDGGGGGGYNPLQPWSASQRGSSYRPQKRTVRRS